LKEFNGLKSDLDAQIMSEALKVFLTCCYSQTYILVVVIRNVIITMASPSSLSLCHFKVQQHLHCYPRNLSHVIFMQGFSLVFAFQQVLQTTSSMAETWLKSKHTDTHAHIWAT